MKFRGASFAMPVLVIGAVLTMIIPVPPMLLDFFLATSITVAILLLLSVVFMKDAVDFSVFPSLLLVLTLIRLALNVSSTRLILLDGYAGKVIETFGRFVIGGSVVVGLVVFMILVVIQFAVITNGAGRTAEVSARFTLDAMPGKQMAIDADLASGLIDEAKAKELRERISKEADFYGAMDGASKFVKGDALAGVFIVLVNLIGGFAIGMGSQGLSLSDAVSTYTLLTVGDGLVSQIPALLISISSGLLVTRVASDNDLGDEVAAQLFGVRRAVRIAAVVIGCMALLPGLPRLPFLFLAFGLYLISTRIPTADLSDDEVAGGDAKVAPSPDDPEQLIGDMRVEPLEVHLSYDILDLIDPERGGDLLERVRALRRQIAMELGFVMPLVRTRDDLTLPPDTYRVLLDGSEVGRGTAPRGRIMCLPAGDGSELAALGGLPTTEPVFGLPAFWVDAERKSAAGATGATVVDRSSVLVTHLAEVVRRSASRLLTRQDVTLLVDGLRYDQPILAKDIDDDVIPLTLLHSVLQGLLDDGVSIRHLGRIVEALTSAPPDQRNAEYLVAAARVGLGSFIVAKIAPDGRLAVVTFDPAYEAGLHEALRDIDGERRLVLDPGRTEHLSEELRQASALEAELDQPMAILCSQHLRKPLRRLMAGVGADVEVLAYPELPDHLSLTTVATLGVSALPERAVS